MQYRECRTCGELLEVSSDNYYIKLSPKGRIIFNNPDCKRCYLEKDRLDRLYKKENEGCGSNTIYQTPNKYADDIQKNQTFEFLTLLGWKFNEEKGIWYDGIKKTKDGEFIGVWEPRHKKKKQYIPKLTEVTFVPFCFSKMSNVKDESKQETIQLMLKDYFIYELTAKKISDKYEVAESLVKYYVQAYIKQLDGKHPERNAIADITREYSTNRQPLKDIPKLRVTHQRLLDKYSQEFIRQIQEDYFLHTMKYKNVLEKYADDESFARYVIHKTMVVLKNKKDAKRNS
jgi:hypothetical protein